MLALHATTVKHTPECLVLGPPSQAQLAEGAGSPAAVSAWLGQCETPPPASLRGGLGELA